MTGALDPEVRDIPVERRFVLEQDGAIAELVYRREPGGLVLVHTGVPDQLGGRGIGGRLVRAAAQRAADEHLTIVPECPFARRWLSDHPEVTGTIAVAWGPGGRPRDSDDGSDE